MYGAHFPVTQTVIALGLFQTSMALGYVVSAIATMVAAILLWNFVEKPFLHKGNWYLRKSKQDEQAAG